MSIVQASILASNSALPVQAFDPGSGISALVFGDAGLLRKKASGLISYDDPSWWFDKNGTSESIILSSIGIDENDTAAIFSLEFTGYFKPTVTGIYKFYTSSDDGSYLWIGTPALEPTTGNANVNNGGAHGTQTEYSIDPVYLTAGTYYPFRVQMYDSGGGWHLDVGYSSNNGVTYSTDFTGLIFYEQTPSGLQGNPTVNFDISDNSSWPGTGTTLTNIGSLGSGYNATLHNDITVNSYTNYKAMVLDKTQLQYASMSSLPLALEEYTIAAWVKLNSLFTPGAGPQIVTEVYTGSNDINFAIGDINGNGHISGGFFTQNNTTWSTTDSFVPNTGKYYYVVLTYSQSGSLLRLYVNGVKISEGITAALVGKGGAGIDIGRRWDLYANTNSYFDGEIAAVHFYDSALSANNVKLNFNAWKNRYGYSRGL